MLKNKNTKSFLFLCFILKILEDCLAKKIQDKINLWLLLLMFSETKEKYFTKKQLFHENSKHFPNEIVLYIENSFY